MRVVLILSLLLIYLSDLSAKTNNQKLIWGIQFGSTKEEKAQGIALDDSANVYVVGYTYGDIAQTNAGLSDAFLVKYTADGELVRALQIGTNMEEWIYSVEIDKDYNCYIAGTTGGSLGDSSNAGGLDCFIAKLNPAGEIVWLNQFGSVGDDYLRKIVLDSVNNIYACGYTYGQLGAEHFGNSDAFVTKLNDQGVQQWIKQYGNDQDEYCVSLILDNNGDIWATGSTKGNWDGTNKGDYDNFVFRLNNDGELLKLFQYGESGLDESYGIAIDEEGIMYIGGCSYNYYATITAMDSNGTALWDRQLGAGNSWSGTWEVKIFPDSSGDILVGGCLNWENSKAFMRRYTREGILVWENLLFKDESKMTNGRVVSIDKDGNCFQIGYTTDNLFCESIGDKDAFLIKIDGIEAAPNSIDGLNLNIPDNFQFYQNYPNPFNPVTQIEYKLKNGALVRLTIYSISGQKIKTLVHNRQAAGNYKASWDAANDNNIPVGSGIYVCKLEFDGYMLAKKMLYLK
jgi:hypothetical protein